jgi:TetR/AcrR family transcriptional regulator, cholesterol catabolism regulator
VGDADHPRERILRVAADLFMNQGYAATSVREIGQRAGISQSALYHHIESKAHLLRALHERFIVEMLGQLREAAASEAPASERLRSMICVVMQIIEDHQAEVTVFLREAHALPAEIRDPIVRQRDAVDEIFDRTIQAGIDSGEFRPDIDVHLTRLAILGMCNWAYQWFRPDSGRTSEGIGAEFAQLALRGLARHPAPAKPATAPAPRRR